MMLTFPIHWFYIEVENPFGKSELSFLGLLEKISKIAIFLVLASSDLGGQWGQIFVYFLGKNIWIIGDFKAFCIMKIGAFGQNRKNIFINAI